MKKTTPTRPPEASHARVAHVQPADPSERTRAAAGALAEYQDDAPQQELGATASPTSAPPPPPQESSRPEAEVTDDVGCVLRACFGLVALARVRRNPDHRPNLERLERRAEKMAPAIARRLSPGLANAAFWVGMAADMACDFLEAELMEAMRPRAQVVDAQ